jgi:hypothetical protein
MKSTDVSDKITSVALIDFDWPLSCFAEKNFALRQFISKNDIGMGWLCSAQGEIRNSQNISITKPLGKRACRESRGKYEDNIKLDLKEPE